MAITATNLDSNKNNGASSITTASISPTANKLILVSVYNQNNTTSTAPTPTVSGASMTWTQVTTKADDNAGTGGHYARVTVFRALSASPGSGTLTIDCTSTQDGIHYSIDEFTNTKTSGTNGADAIAQSTSNGGTTGTSLTVTLSAFSDSNNATYGAFGINASTASTVGSGFTSLSTNGVGTGRSHTEWKNTNDTSVDVTWADSTSSAGIAIELAHVVIASSGTDSTYSFFL